MNKIEIRVGYTDILESVNHTLEYYSGKRAKDPQEYFRFAVCDADKQMLRTLLEEACCIIDLHLGKYGGGYTVKLDEICFTVLTVKPVDENRTRTFETFIHGLLVRLVVKGWLRLAGFEGEFDTADLTSLLSQLTSHLGTGRYPVFGTIRSVPPF